MLLAPLQLSILCIKFRKKTSSEHTILISNSQKTLDTIDIPVIKFP